MIQKSPLDMIDNASAAIAQEAHLWGLALLHRTAYVIQPLASSEESQESGQNSVA